MDKLADIISLFDNAKSDKEKLHLLQSQQAVIANLLKKIAHLEEKLKDVEKLLADSTKLIESPTERSIMTPEEAVIAGQIQIIQDRGSMGELSLEDVKKLDILIKNKIIVKEKPTWDGKPKKSLLSPAELVLIAKKTKDST